MNDSIWLELGVALVMAAGLAGTILPFVPGLPLIWGAALAYGLIESFGTVGVVAMIVITVLLVAGVSAKIVVPQRRASAGGAPRSTLILGALAGIVGFFLIPVVGLPLGAVAGVFVAEYRRTNDWAAARRSTREVVIGFGIGTLIEMGAGLMMIVTWVAWVLVAS
jgi:uncharacterized protein